MIDHCLQLAKTKEVGSLGVYHLKRLWSKTMLIRSGEPLGLSEEGDLDRLVLDSLGLGLHQSVQYLYREAPSFERFEEWIVMTAGQPSEERVSRLNADIDGSGHSAETLRELAEIEAMDPVLSREQLSFWEENGYVVLNDAVSEESRLEVERILWNHVGSESESPETWYQTKAQGIMVELIQHPALAALRRSPRIHKAFAQLWGTADLWVSSDRCGFHPPQREDWPFPGPDLHWDLDFSLPPTFATQGILYLTDTPPEQGALTVVPGFHRRLSDWLAALPAASDPQGEDLHALGSMPIGGKAGDLVIWNHALPHGSRPNLGVRPRMVQYINMYPGRHRVPSGCYGKSPVM